MNGIEETGKSYHAFIKRQLKIFKSLSKQGPNEIMKRIFDGHTKSYLNLYEEVQRKSIQKGLNSDESHNVAEQEAEKHLKSFDLRIQNKYFENSQRELFMKFQTGNGE